MTDVSGDFSAADKEALAVDPAMPMLAIRIPKAGELSRKERDDIRLLIPDRAKNRIKVFDDFKRIERNLATVAAGIRETTEAQEDDLIVLVAGSTASGSGAVAAGDVAGQRRQNHRATEVCAGAGQLRLALAQKYAERHRLFEEKCFRFLWVTDFPMFEWDETEGRWNAAHHPFTSLHEEDMDKLTEGLNSVGDPNSVLGDIRSRAYDVVLNGTELGSGSIRIHRQDVQAKIFAALGMSAQEQKQRFGFFLEALQYGTPPHGGIALGLDRIVMILAGASSLREVIPFPKTAGSCRPDGGRTYPCIRGAAEGAGNTGEEVKRAAVTAIHGNTVVRRTVNAGRLCQSYGQRSTVSGCDCTRQWRQGLAGVGFLSSPLVRANTALPRWLWSPGI